MQTAVMRLAQLGRVPQELCTLHCINSAWLTPSYAAHVLRPGAAMALQFVAIDSTRKASHVWPVPTADYGLRA